MSFRRFFLVRLGWAVFGLWLAAMVVFGMTRVFSALAIEEFKGAREPVQAYAGYVEGLRLDDPVHKRYADFLSDLVHGESLITAQNSGGIARDAVPVTLALVIPALLLSLALGTAAGIAWGRAPRVLRRVGDFAIYVAIGLTPIWLGLLASFYFGFKWGITPGTGYCDFVDPPKNAPCGGPGDWFSHLILPVMTLSLFFAAVYARIVRSVFAPVRAANSKEDKARLRRRFALVLARLAGRDFGYMIGAALLVEAVFSLPGLGGTVFFSLAQADFSVLEAVLVYAAFLGIAVHFVMDVIVGALDADLRAEWPVAGMPKPT